MRTHYIDSYRSTMTSIFLHAFLFCVAVEFSLATERPVIGIVVHEITSSKTKSLSPNSTAYLAASYVRAVEGAGARVAAVKLGQNESYYRNILSRVNGILIPGGDAEFNVPNGYADAVNILYKEAIKLNEDKDHMPILGVCLGFEILIHVSNKNKELRADCKSSNVGLPLHFKPDFQDSQLFRDADPYILQILSTQPVTSNHHEFCVTEKNLTKFDLDKEWKVLSTNEDDNGFEFISTVESKHYPIVGIQFHPEKNAYEWKSVQNNPHSADAILSARLFFDWLIRESRKSNHTFESSDDEYNAMIYNYPLRYTAPKNMTFEEIYLF